MPIVEIHPDEDIFASINRINGWFANSLYGQLLGAANDFKDGDATRNLAASDHRHILPGAV